MTVSGALFILGHLALFGIAAAGGVCGVLALRSARIQARSLSWERQSQEEDFKDLRREQQSNMQQLQIRYELQHDELNRLSRRYEELDARTGLMFQALAAGDHPSVKPSRFEDAPR